MQVIGGRQLSPGPLLSGIEELDWREWWRQENKKEWWAWRSLNVCQLLVYDRRYMYTSKVADSYNSKKGQALTHVPKCWEQGLLLRSRTENLNLFAMFANIFFLPKIRICYLNWVLHLTWFEHCDSLRDRINQKVELIQSIGWTVGECKTTIQSILYYFCCYKSVLPLKTHFFFFQISEKLGVRHGSLSSRLCRKHSFDAVSLVPRHS